MRSRDRRGNMSVDASANGYIRDGVSIQPSATRNAWHISAAGAVAVILGSALAVWPTLVLAGAVVAFVVVLAVRAPEYAFLVSIVLFASEGLLKAGLVHEGTPLTVSNNAVGAALLDLCLIASFLALLRHDSAGRLKQVWRNLPGLARTALGLLPVWIVVSVAQAVSIGSLNEGVQGLRLVQAYVVAGVLGALLIGRLPSRLLTLLLLSGLLIVSGYAVFRLVTGPGAFERTYNLTRAGPETYGGVGRAAGSFSAAAGLASYLVPAAVFSFVLAIGLPRHRLLATAVFGCSVVGILGSYVRVGIVALALGLLLGGVLLLAQGDWTHRQRVLMVSAVSLVLVAGGIGTAIASRSSADLRERARGFVHPLEDESVRLRLSTWETTLGDFRDHPLGTGVGSVGRASASNAIADNSYLKVLREQGWIGGPIFIAGVVLLLVSLVLASLDRSRPLDPVAVGALAGAFAFLVLGFAGEYIEQPGKVLAWLLLGLAVFEVGCGHARDELLADG